MIWCGVVALLVGPFVFGAKAAVLALGFFALAAIDPVGRRLARHTARRRAGQHLASPWFTSDASDPGD